MLSSQQRMEWSTSSTVLKLLLLLLLNLFLQVAHHNCYLVGLMLWLKDAHARSLKMDRLFHQIPRVKLVELNSL